MLKVLFGGGVIRGKKLQRGSVYTFADSDLSTPRFFNEDQISKLYEKNKFVQNICPIQQLLRRIAEKKLNPVTLKIPD